MGLMYGKRFISKKHNNNVFKGFCNVIEIKHSISGRIRFFIPELVNSSQAKEVLELKMINIDGINSVNVNAISGSLIVCYENEKIDNMLLLGVIIRLLGLDEQLESKKTCVVKNEIKKLNEALNYSVHEKSKGLLDLKTLIPLLFAVYGLKGIYFTNKNATPNPYSLLYWAYKSLTGEGK